MGIPFEVVDTLKQYEELQTISDIDTRRDYFRYKMMRLFEPMWSLINVPLKAREENGYDVIMATKMLGYADLSNDSQIDAALTGLKKHEVSSIVHDTMKNCIDKIEENNLKIKAEKIKVGLYVADPIKLHLHKGYSGFGGIPGYITVTVYPNSYNIPKLPAVIAHEFHHNIRFSYFDWDHGNVTVGDYLVIEGLADSFAKELYGVEQLGPWVTSMDKEDLEYSIYVIGEALNTKGFAEVSSYMFGDEIAKQEGYQPVGLSFCAGYAVGYEVVQAFLKNTGSNIYEASLLSTKEIIKGSRLF
ncbi:DUF2268 domain-containing protein [Priestia megaterium]|uniref:DUF2268 domain-containing protein n=1 Tax=Priestia megaterium TaxID=1404 RepID=UPI00203F1C10|nr:DUF2268 domain-containing putative Zn-dependent protease [Priestia megaterium]MCM3541473.1 DUF2268 domain-containing putative Zn-dependent protease [Priestia megaterium]